MGRFDVYTETVDIEHNGNEYSYTLRPLAGEHIQSFYKAVQAVQGMEDGDISNLDAEGMGHVHKITYECLKDDAGDASDEELDRFVSQHLFELLNPVMQVNMSQIDEDKLEEMREKVQEG